MSSVPSCYTNYTVPVVIVIKHSIVFTCLVTFRLPCCPQLVEGAVVQRSRRTTTAACIQSPKAYGVDQEDRSSRAWRAGRLTSCQGWSLGLCRSVWKGPLSYSAALRRSPAALQYHTAKLFTHPIACAYLQLGRYFVSCAPHLNGTHSR